MQIRCWGHGAKLFAAWLTVNFPFWQALLHCLLPVCHCPFIAHQPLLSPWTIQLCSPSSTRPCVPLCLSVSVSCVSPSSLSLLLSSSSSLWSSECCAFYDCPYTESSLSPGQVDRPWSDTMNILSARPTPPFLSFPTWIDWMMDGLEGIYCLCVWGVGLSGIHIHVCATKWSYPQLQCICGLTIDSWCYRLHLKQAGVKECIQTQSMFLFWTMLKEHDETIFLSSTCISSIWAVKIPEKMCFCYVCAAVTQCLSRCSSTTMMSLLACIADISYFLFQMFHTWTHVSQSGETLETGTESSS